MKTNKLTQFAAFLADHETVAEGFSTKFLYETGTSQFGLKWAEVNKYFLKPEFKLTRGKFSGLVSEADTEAYEDAPIKMPKAPKTPKAVTVKKAAAKTPAVKAPKASKLPKHEVTAPMDPAAKEARLELITKIAKRNAATDAVIAELTK